MVPAIIYAEKKAKLKPVFIAAVGLMFAAQLIFAYNIHHFWGIVTSLVVYFVAFNILEASVTLADFKDGAGRRHKVLLMGVHNTAQSFGMFLGATVGGYLSHRFDYAAVFLFLCCTDDDLVSVGFWHENAPQREDKDVSYARID